MFLGGEGEQRRALWSEWESNPLDLFRSAALASHLPEHALAPYTYIIPYYVGFVKRFSKNICNYFSYSNLQKVWAIKLLFYLCSRFLLTTRPYFSRFSVGVPLLTTIILYHKSGDLSRGFEKFLERFCRLRVFIDLIKHRRATVSSCALPLDYDNIIP